MSTATSAIVWGAAPIVAFGVIMAVAIGWDRYRAPRRDPVRPRGIGCERQYRDEARRADRLAARGDWTRAYSAAVGVCVWLASERHYGGRRRRERLTRALADWQARAAEYNPQADVAAAEIRGTE